MKGLAITLATVVVGSLVLSSCSVVPKAYPSRRPPSAYTGRRLVLGFSVAAPGSTTS